MDVLTLYVGQGSLVGIRVGNEGIIVDAHMPDGDDVSPEEIKQSLSVYFRSTIVRGFILSGFDSDHAHAGGVEWILSNFKPEWIMYPKCFKDTDCATEVFRAIDKHQKQRASTDRPLIRHSIRLDRLDSREIKGLGRNFTLEVFSPHIEDMDSSNNCSIVAKLTGTGGGAFRYLITGDTESDRWKAISRLFGTQIAADVMAAAHHGALSGAEAAALLHISPNTVLISAGVGSQYNHPDAAAIRAYQAVAKHVWATNAGGTGKNLLTRRDGSDFKSAVFGHASAVV